MGKGSSKPAPAPTSQTVTQTNLPEYARPYFENILRRTEAESYRPYQTYGGDRIAGFTPAQEALQTETLGLQRPGQFGAATQGAAGTGILGIDTAARGIDAAFDPTQDYMSPYIQGALAPQIREAQLAGDLAQQRAMGSAIKGGTFGGSRQALMSAEMARGTQQNISDIVGRGYQSAFDAAQRQQQFLGGLGMQGLQQSGTAAQLLGQLGTSQQAADINRLQTQQQTAAQPQALEQQRLDMAYQDFLRQRDYPLEQLGFYSNILRGLPVQMGSTQLTYQQPPNMASQIAGLGAAGFGLGKLTGAFAKGGEVKPDYNSGLAKLMLYKVTG